MLLAKKYEYKVRSGCYDAYGVQQTFLNFLTFTDIIRNTNSNTFKKKYTDVHFLIHAIEDHETKIWDIVPQEV